MSSSQERREKPPTAPSDSAALLRLRQSLCVERVLNNELWSVRDEYEADDEQPLDAEDYYDNEQQPRISTRLEWSLQAMQLRDIMKHSATPLPFSNLRSLVASHAVFNRLLDFSRLLISTHSHSTRPAACTMSKATNTTSRVAYSAHTCHRCPHCDDCDWRDFVSRSLLYPASRLSMYGVQS